jgi:hypothetical protein
MIQPQRFRRNTPPEGLQGVPNADAFRRTSSVCKKASALKISGSCQPFHFSTSPKPYSAAKKDTAVRA